MQREIIPVTDLQHLTGEKYGTGSVTGTAMIQIFFMGPDQTKLFCIKKTFYNLLPGLTE